MPRSSTPTLSPGLPLVEQLAEHLDARCTVVFCVSRIPTISTSSPTLTMPRSTRPVTTVPRPEIVNTSSTGIRNGLSSSRTGSGMNDVARLHQLEDRLRVLVLPAVALAAP